jgi:hypothetical protein
MSHQVVRNIERADRATIAALAPAGVGTSDLGEDR